MVSSNLNRYLLAIDRDDAEVWYLLHKDNRKADTLPEAELINLCIETGASHVLEKWILKTQLYKEPAQRVSLWTRRQRGNVPFDSPLPEQSIVHPLYNASLNSEVVADYLWTDKRTSIGFGLAQPLSTNGYVDYLNSITGYVGTDAIYRALSNHQLIARLYGTRNLGKFIPSTERTSYELADEPGALSRYLIHSGSGYRVDFVPNLAPDSPSMPRFSRYNKRFASVADYLTFLSEVTEPGYVEETFSGIIYPELRSIFRAEATMLSKRFSS